MTNTSYCLYLQTSFPTFEERTQSLLMQITEKEDIISLTFFGESRDENYETELNILKMAVSHAFGEAMPLVTYVKQPLNHSEEMAVEVLYFPTKNRSDTFSFKKQGDLRYAVYEWNNTKILLLEGVRANSLNDSASIQSEEIFQKIEKILSVEKMYIHDIVRQWNYIGSITEMEDGIQNYQAFNNARARFYAKVNWDTFGYPAATGIGTTGRGIMVNLIAVSAKPNSTIVGIDNPLQIAAHHYSLSMLVGSKEKHTLATPKFERAKVIQKDSRIFCFISGTAAIRGEQSMQEMNAAMQTKQTIENIIYLVSTENLRRQGVSNDSTLRMAGIRVYIKNKEDFEMVKEEVDKVWFGVPTLYVQADVCRRELLVEIEGLVVGEK